ncbi:MAG: ribbon-helix-helix protein, CopG family [Snowella sp.]
MAKKIHLTVRISESLNERLDHLVAVTGSSKNQVLNECLRRGAFTAKHIPLALPPSKETLAQLLGELDQLCQSDFLDLIAGD